MFIALVSALHPLQQLGKQLTHKEEGLNPQRSADTSKWRSEEKSKNESWRMGCCITDILWKNYNLRCALNTVSQKVGNAGSIGWPWRLGWFLQSFKVSDEAQFPVSKGFCSVCVGQKL